MRRRSPPPSLSFQSRLAVRSDSNTIPTSPSYSAPYTPSVYSYRLSEAQFRPSVESSRSDGTDTMQISTQLRQAWAEIQGHHQHYHDDDMTVADGESVGGSISDDELGASYQRSDQFLDIEDADGPGSRLSVMGPKMKVLSKAPWESGASDGDDSPGDDDLLREDNGIKDDMSEVGSIFTRSLGHPKKPHERNKVGTPKSTGESDQNNSKGWMGFVSRAPRTRVEPPLKDMISAPLSFAPTSGLPSALSPTHAHFQRATTSSPDSGNGNFRSQNQQRRAVSSPSHPRTDSLVSAASSCTSSVPSPYSDRFQSHSSSHHTRSTSPNHYLSSSSSSILVQVQQQTPVPVAPLSLPIRTQVPSITDDTSRTSEDDDFHPFANPELYHITSSPPPPPHPTSGSHAAECYPPASISASGGPASSLSSGLGSGIGSLSLLNPRSESATTLTATNSTGTIALSAASPFPSPSPSSVAFPISPSLGSPSLGSGLSAILSADAAARASKSPKDRRTESEVNMAGMQAHAYPGSPAYNLLTLEQAQERIRSRAKSGPAQSATASHPTPIAAGAGAKNTVSGVLPRPNLNRKVASQGNFHSGPASSAPTTGERAPFSRHAVGESPPLPALPPSSPSSNPSAPPSSGPAAAASSKTVRPKRSGFFKLFSGGDKEKSIGSGSGSGTANRLEQEGVPPLPEGFVHVAMARSISSFDELGIIPPSSASFVAAGKAEPSPIRSESDIPPIPPVPAQYRRDPYRKADTSNTVVVSPTSIDSPSLSQSLTISGPPAQRVRIPAVVTASPMPSPLARSRTDPTPTPSLATSNQNTGVNSRPKAESTPKMGWNTLKKKASWGRAISISDTSGLNQQQQAIEDSSDLPSLQLRPMSGLFSSGLPIDLIGGDSSPPSTYRGSPGIVVVDGVDQAGNVKNDSSLGVGTGARRRPLNLGIGIPEESLHADAASDLYSPVTASSLSSGRSTTTSVSTATTTAGPTTPTSSRSLNDTQHQTVPPSSALGPSFSPRAHLPTTAPIDPQVHIQILQDRLVQERKAWQLQRWEFEAQIRELETQVALRAASCNGCRVALGKTTPVILQSQLETVGNVIEVSATSGSGDVPLIRSSIMSRPRPRAGTPTPKWAPG